MSFVNHPYWLPVLFLPAASDFSHSASSFWRTSNFFSTSQKQHCTNMCEDAHMQRSFDPMHAWTDVARAAHLLAIGTKSWQPGGHHGHYLSWPIRQQCQRKLVSCFRSILMQTYTTFVWSSVHKSSSFFRGLFRRSTCPSCKPAEPRGAQIGKLLLPLLSHPWWQFDGVPHPTRCNWETLHVREAGNTHPLCQQQGGAGRLSARPIHKKIGFRV